MDVTGEEVLVSGVKLSLAQGTKSSPAVSSWARVASILFLSRCGFVFMAIGIIMRLIVWSFSIACSKSSDLANYYGSFSSIVVLVGDQQAGKILGLEALY